MNGRKDDRSHRRMGVRARLLRSLRASEPARGYALLSPTLLYVVFGLGFAVVLVFAYSFWTQDYLSLDRRFTFANYEAFASKEVFAALLLRSIRISALVTLATVVIAYPCAYFVAFHIKRHKLFWIAIVTVPFFTSYLLRVFAWKVVLGYQGIVNSALILLGVVDEPLEFLLYSETAVILTLAHAWAAWAILPIYVSIEKIDRSLLEAATDLGDGPVARFLRVTLPLSMPGVIAASLMVFIPTVGDYVTPALVGGTDGMMIANIIQSQFGKANNWPLGATLSVISMATIAVLVCGFLWLNGKIQKRFIA